MACFHPLDAWQGPSGGPVAFKASAHFRKYLQVPCGQCIGCRLERARQWAIRCVNEASCWDYNSFITVTYSDEFLPKDGSISVETHQKFMKRLRDRLKYPSMKFYMCGEYGDTYGRPHYHYLLFGVKFFDQVLFRTTPNGDKLYTSALLDDIWGMGHCQIGSVTFDSACYVARYIMKKQTGKASVDAYNVYDPVTGEVFASLTPEFNRMSRASGIGKEYYLRNAADIYPRDMMVSNGVRMRPPRYYDNKYEVSDPLRMAWVKKSRRDRGALRAADNTPDRLQVREGVLSRRMKQFSRKVE